MREGDVFHLDVVRAVGYVGLVLIGDLDLSRVSQVHSRWRTVLESRPPVVLVDLSRITFLDGRGARLLLRLHHEATAEGVPWGVVTGGNRWVCRPLELLRWEQGLPLFTTREAALRALRDPDPSPAQAPAPGIPENAPSLVLWEGGRAASMVHQSCPLADRIFGTARRCFRQPHPFFHGIPEEDRPRLLTAIRPAANGHDRWRHIEYPVHLPEGEIQWWWDLLQIQPTGRPGGGRVLGISLEITPRKRSEEALRASEERFRRIAELAQEGLWSLDAEGRSDYLNPRLAQMLGWAREEILGRPVLELLPTEDRAELEGLLEHLRRGDGDHRDFRFHRPDGSEGWGILSARPVLDESGKLAAACAVVTDITDRKRWEQQIQENEQRLRCLIDLNTDAVFTLDPEGRLVDCNPAGERISGFCREELLGRFFSELVPPDRLDLAEEGFLLTLNGATVSRDAAIINASGQRVELEVTTVPIQIEGRVTGIFGIARDITERKRREAENAALLERERAAREEMAAARDRLLFLLRTGRVLSSSLDYRSTVERMARLAVPLLGDHCVVDVLEPDHSIRRLCARLADAESGVVAVEEVHYPTEHRGLIDMAGEAPSGRPALFADPARLASILQARYPAELLMLQELHPQALMCAPLMARDRVLGAITFVRTTPERPFSRDDLEVAEELARTAALALDNARLYRVQQEIARTLQQNLLPPTLPQIPGLEVAAAYRAAGEGIEVGGDFYDLFETPGGSWTVVIGDVTGKGPSAATITSLIRHTIRALAVRLRWPAQILAQANAMIMDQIAGEYYSTALCARFTPLQRKARLRFSSAGHLPPLVLRRNGSFERLDQPGFMLGLQPAIELKDRAVELSAGDAVIFYTDGVTEARTGGKLFGEERLEALVRECAGCDAQEIVRRIERAVLEFQHGHPADDIAIVVLRVSP